jgi:hypothetical protein
LVILLLEGVSLVVLDLNDPRPLDEQVAGAIAGTLRPVMARLGVAPPPVIYPLHALVL